MAISFDRFSNVIDGKLVDTKATRHGINPATEEPLLPVPVSTEDDVNAAVDAANRAASAWAKVPLEERQQKVIQFADLLATHTDAFAKMLTLEQGKPLWAATGEMGHAVAILKGAASLPFPTGETIQDTESKRVITKYVPVGVCVGIVPWNFPVNLATFKLGSALVAGCPMIIKPSPFTPYCGLKLVELAQEIFPPGVVQALSGDDNLGPWLTAAPNVHKVTFTGSTQTGIKVLQSASKNLKRVTLELGGNDPAIICSDVNLQIVAPTITEFALYNSGQVCVAIKRVYVHSSIYDEFIAAMAAYLKTMKVSSGMDEGTKIGPIQNSMQYNRLKDLVASIQSEKLKVAAGDVETAFSETKGYFMNPIIVENPPDNSRIVVEEPFGPVFPVLKWDTEEEVIRRANNSESGLGASVWTSDSAQAERIADQLEAGNVWINGHSEMQPDAPFGGHKHSGIGSELGIEGLKAFCNVQTQYYNKGA